MSFKLKHDKYKIDKTKYVREKVSFSGICLKIKNNLMERKPLIDFIPEINRYSWRVRENLVTRICHRVYTVTQKMADQGRFGFM